MTSPALLTKALLKAAELLGLLTDLAAALQIPADQALQLQSGSRQLDPQADEWQRALQIVSLVRTLVLMFGTIERARAWLHAPNDVLGAPPVELLKTTDSERVYRYLTAVHKNELRMPGASFN